MLKSTLRVRHARTRALPRLRTHDMTRNVVSPGGLCCGLGLEIAWAADRAFLVHAASSWRALQRDRTTMLDMARGLQGGAVVCSESVAAAALGRGTRQCRSVNGTSVRRHWYSGTGQES